MCTSYSDQERWIDAARSVTAGQLERLIRGIRRVRKIEEDAADPELAEWKMHATKSYDDDGNAVYRIVMPAEQSAVVDAGLEAMQAELDRRRAADASAEASSPQAATLADALVEMARTALDAAATASPSTARRHRSSLVAQIDPVSGWGRLKNGELLLPTSLRAVMKTLPSRGGLLRLKKLTPADMRVHDLGRNQRQPSLALRELLGALDGERCRFPGCTRHKKLHAHHVEYWSNGGATDLGNLVKS